MFRFVPLLLMLPLQAGALTLDLPANAVQSVEPLTEMRSYELPLGPWSDEGFPTERLEGSVTRQIFRIPSNSLTPFQIMTPIKEQLVSQGWEILLDCETEDCGGYDFRFATEVARAPEMQVAIGNFRFLSARQDSEAVSLFVSRTAREVFVQFTHLGHDDFDVATTIPAPQATVGPEIVSGSLAEQLESQGHIVLDDLSFETGSAQLGQGDFLSLTEIAAYLAESPDRRIALVGHTDASGSLEGNISLSKRRAGSVLERLVTDHGANRAQLEAEGMGYLAPLTTNLTDEGRTANRRVEAILLSTE